MPRPRKRSKMIKCELQILAYRLLTAIEKIRIASIGGVRRAKENFIVIMRAVVLFTTYIGIQDIGRCKWYHEPTTEMVKICKGLEVEVTRF